MEHYNYLIIGGGMTADAAARGIRELDASSSIGIISDDSYGPHDRGPLTRELWFGTPLDAIFRKTEKENVTLHLDRRVVSVNPETSTVQDHVGNTYWYEKLLFSTGGSPIAVSNGCEGIVSMHSLSDYLKVRQMHEVESEFIVIGSGFVGTEIAAALNLNGRKITLITDEPQINASRLPHSFSEYLTNYYKERGIQVITEQSVSSASFENLKYTVTTSTGAQFGADGVIAGLGLTPNVQLAESIGLDVNEGITVDRYLRTSHDSIYAAGDVANFYSPHLKKRIRWEHDDAANTMGWQAGRNMAGAKEPYSHLPSYHSEMFDFGYEAVGEISSSLEMVEDWQEEYRKGAIYYLQEGVVRGGMLWGIWDQIDRIREMIASQETYETKELVGMIRF